MSNQQMTYSANVNGQDTNAPPAAAGGGGDVKDMAPDGEIQVRQCMRARKSTLLPSAVDMGARV